MNINIPTKLRGRYKIEAIQPNGSKRLLADWFDNLVTDNGLNLYATSAAKFNTCCVGSGSATPANSDTSLQTLVGSTATIITGTNSAAGASPYVGTTTLTYRFAAGTATGNLSEVGVGVAANNLFSRALILDGVGAPTTITVLSTEALDVTYQFQQWVPLVDVTGTVVINAVSYAYTIRAASAAVASAWAMSATNNDRAGLRQCQVFNGAIGAITATPSGASALAGSIAVQAYTTGNFFIDSIASFGLADGNVASGVSAVLLTFGIIVGTTGAFQVGVTPSIPKDSSHVMTLTFRQSWARHP